MDEIKFKGELGRSLQRDTKAVKNARFLDLYENLEIQYGREIQDIQADLRSMKREQSGLFDFAPDNSFSLVAKNVDAREIMKKDLELQERIRVKEIDLINAQARYDRLFTDLADSLEDTNISAKVN